MSGEHVRTIEALLLLQRMLAILEGLENPEPTQLELPFAA